MPEADYAEIRKAIEEAGFHTAFHSKTDGNVSIVAVTSRTDGRLHGNSFQLSLKAGRWYLITWSPVFYLVPPGADLAALCLDCLHASRTPISEVPRDIASRHQLLAVSESEYEQT